MLDLVKAFYRFLVSMRCAVFILLLLAVSSVLGTLIPQFLSEEAMMIRFGGLGKIVFSLGFGDIYHSFWFQFLLAFLCINMLLCTMERLPKTIKLWKHTEEDLNEEKLSKMSHFMEFTSERGFAEVSTSVRDALGSKWKRRYDRSYVRSSGERVWKASFFRGRNALFSVYGVHVSIILILLGALSGSLFGFRGVMNILEGEASNVVYLPGKDKALLLPFELKCDDFEIEFYPEGLPKEYISRVIVIAGGSEVLRKEIKVNHPFTYEGMSFYQATYGVILKEAHVKLTEDATGEEYNLKLTMEREEAVPGKNTILQLMDYREDFNGFGPAVAIGMLEEGKTPEAAWILVNHPDFHGNRLGSYRVSAQAGKPYYYTGIQVKRDPGVNTVLFGFSTLIIFVFMAFYWNYKMLWVVVEESNPAVKVYLAGKGGKNRRDFDKEFELLCNKIQTGG